MDSYIRQAKWQQALNTIGFVVTIIVNGLANGLPLNGKTTGEILDSYPNLFAPAGITFAIWGGIYVGLGLFIIYQLGFLSKGKKGHFDIVSRIGWSFVIASVANSLWIFAWHYDKIILSVIIMFALLTSLIDIYEKLSKRQTFSIVEKITVKWVFSVYLSWISVATIANIIVFLVSVNCGGFGIPPQVWTMLVILVATALTLRFVFYKKDMPYALVTLWAFLGILIKHLTFFGGEYKGIIIMTAFCMMLIFASIYSIPKGFQMQGR